MVTCIRVKKSVLGWKKLLAISSSSAFAVLPLFFFSAFPNDILFLRMLVKNLSFCSTEKMHLTLLYFLPPYCVLSSLPDK